MKSLLATIAILLCGLIVSRDVHAQAQYPTAGGAIVSGHVGMCLDATGKAITIGPNCASPVNVAPTYQYKAPTYCQFTNMSVAKVLTSTTTCDVGSILPNWSIAQICVVPTGNTVTGRYLSAPGDGASGHNPTAPTSSVGMPVSGGFCFPYAGPQTFDLICASCEGDMEFFP